MDVVVREGVLSARPRLFTPHARAYQRLSPLARPGLDSRHPLSYQPFRGTFGDYGQAFGP